MGLLYSSFYCKKTVTFIIFCCFVRKENFAGNQHLPIILRGFSILLVAKAGKREKPLLKIELTLESKHTSSDATELSL